VVIVGIALCLILSSFSLIARSESNSSGFTLPCVINTFGNAWDGLLAFDLEGNASYFVIADSNGTVLSLRESPGTNGYGPAYDIAANTLLFEGEPNEDEPNSAWPVWATHVWNLSSNTFEDFLNVLSEHDIQYDPVDNTFLTLQDYVRQIGQNLILMDKVLQVDASGKILWSWDTYDHVPLSEVSPYNETAVVNGQTVEDFTHANSLDWDYKDGIIYLNLRNTNTFYAINQTTAEVIWACGEFGNFTLLGSDGQPVASLWYGSHDLKEVAPDVFTLFNNDYANNTNFDDCRSSLMEITLNETTMTAHVDFNWEAPIQYWNAYGGANVVLPNGDFLGDFGDPTHQYTQNQPWDFNDSGAVFVEVNSADQLVRTFSFPVGWYVYRVEALTDVSPSISISPAPTSTVPAVAASSTLLSTIAAVDVAIVIVVVLAIAKLRNSSKATRTNSYELD